MRNILGLLILSVLAVGLVLSVEAKEETKILECFYEDDSLACAKKIADVALDEIELETMGEGNSEVSFSKVIEESGRLIVDGVNEMVMGKVDDNSQKLDEYTGNREARKKFGKKKRKKLLKRLIPLAMLFKAKISLLLQLISTHFQFKFFGIAILSLIINIVRFWLDLKKLHTPEKVIYYEHAQHQHHYEPEDEHGYWKKRSLDNTPYSAWAPTVESN